MAVFCWQVILNVMSWTMRREVMGRSAWCMAHPPHPGWYTHYSLHNYLPSCTIISTHPAFTWQQTILKDALYFTFDLSGLCCSEWWLCISIWNCSRAELKPPRRRYQPSHLILDTASLLPRLVCSLCAIVTPSSILIPQHLNCYWWDDPWPHSPSLPA